MEPPVPTIGDWYKVRAGEIFEVVAIDDEDATIEIQYFDGSLEELDFDAWNELSAIAVEPPEDWSGSLDIEREDYGVDLDQTLRADWQNPLDDIEQ